MAEWTIQLAAEYCRTRPDTELQVACTGASLTEMRDWLGCRIALVSQRGEGLGERMHDSLADALAGGFSPALVIGTDCPQLDEHVLERASAALETADVVFGPAEDGGYYLVGLTRPVDIFSGITFGRNDVLSASLDRCRSLDLKVACIDRLADIDRPEDLALLPEGFLPT